MGFSVVSREMYHCNCTCSISMLTLRGGWEGYALCNL